MYQFLLDPQAPPSDLGHLKPARPPEAPQTCQAVSPTSGAHRGWQGLSACPQEVVKMQQLYTKELHPSRGWAQTSIGVPHNFPSSSSWRVQDPEHLQEQPKCSPPFLLTPSPGGSVPPCRGIASSRSLCFPFRTAWRALGVQPHPGSSSEEGAGVPGWHQGTLAPLPRCPRRCLCEHGQPLSFLLLSSG